MLGLKVLFLTAWLCGLAFSSVLSETAAKLTARHWALMPANASLGTLSLHYSLLYYCDGGVWDPIKRKVRWVGGPGSCCANPADYKMITYDEATDTWALSNTPFSGGGHAYDANAFNPVAGLHYFAFLGSPTVSVWNDTVWTTLPAAPLSVGEPSLTWFPDINNGQGGLVFLGNTPAWWDGSQWHSIPSAAGLGGFSQYIPAYKSIWLSAAGSRMSYLLDTNLAVRRLADAPFDMGNHLTINTCDPVSGNGLVYNLATDLWWELDMAADTWSQVTDMAPKFSLAFPFHVPIPEYGVILVFNHASSAKYAYLYKHADFVDAEKKKAVAGKAALRVSPNPFRGIVRIALENGLGLESPRISVYDLQGRRVADAVRVSGEFRWDATGFPAGVYVIRAQSGARIMETRLTLLK